MRAAEVALVGALVHRARWLLPVLQEHLDDYDGLLPHVFFADVTRELVKKGSDGVGSIHDVLDFMETSLRFGDEHARELIAASFLENLPPPGESGAQIRDALGPELRRQLELMQ